LNLGNLRLSSPTFGPLGHIPKWYAYDGENLSPLLEWSNAPVNTQEFELIRFVLDPPQGNGPHHYYFWLIFLAYALDTALNLKPGLTREQLVDAIADHIIVQSDVWVFMNCKSN
jgi:phosphatidylethanolamine-binding protein (PEBP) family uncharacterized protein